MIAYIKGILVQADEGTLIVEAGGIGYRVQVPGGTGDRLPAAGSQVQIYTHLSVREDGMSLYGFASEEEAELFARLITVSGIGPRGALAILSVLSVQELMMAVLAEDVKAITRAPGVGPKTAKRLIIELKDKIDAQQVLQAGTSGRQSAGAEDTSAMTNTVLALTSLGYSSSDAYRAVHAVPGAQDMDSSRLLKAALSQIAAMQQL